MTAAQTTRRTVHAGFLGVGNFVSGNHLPNIAASDLWTVHAVCDIDEANLRRAAERYKPPVVTRDYHDLLADESIDAIILGVQHQQHLRFMREIAAAGKHMLVEKPMSTTNEESRQMVEAVQAAGVKLMVGYNRRFGPLYARAKELFQRALGPGRPPAIVTFRAVDDKNFWPDWPFDLNRGGGKILCECCHFFDFLPWFLEAEPQRVFCEGYRTDENLVTIRFSDGSIGAIVSGGGGSVAYPKERLEVFCDASTLVVDQCLELHVEGYEGASDQLHPFKLDPFPDAGADLPPAGAYRAKMNAWLAAGITDEQRQRKAYYGAAPGVDKGHFAEIEAFARAILDDGPSPCDEIAGARATACAVAAIRSMEAGYVPVDVRPDDYLYDGRPH